MKPEEEHLDVLQNLEFAIIEIWRAHPEMTDYSAQRAYEAARQFYRAELRGNPPTLPALTGLKSACSTAASPVPDELAEKIPGAVFATGTSTEFERVPLLLTAIVARAPVVPNGTSTAICPALTK